MMLAWVRGLLLGREDLALVAGAFGRVSCLMESNGVDAIGGFSCLFEAMPHLCTFETREVVEARGWRRRVYLRVSSNVLDSEVFFSTPHSRLMTHDSE